jgi:ketosteroid isomerase-like protein
MVKCADRPLVSADVDMAVEGEVCMNGRMKRLRDLVIAATCALSMLAASPAAPSDESDVKAAIEKWVADFNKGDLKAVVAACAPRAAIVDGFPPYAWQTCADWMNGYEANNKALDATHGTLTIGAPIYTEVMGSHAYFIYPATFSDTQKGKPVVYKGHWTMTLQKAGSRWVFTGSASAWGVNSL